MNSQRKSTDSRNKADRDWSEDLARLHCLKALFPDWTGDDQFLIHQIKESIEASMRQHPEQPDTFEVFSSMANGLREQTPGQQTGSHAFIRLDFSGETWNPLFVRHEIVRQLKQHAGTDHVFLLVRGLRHCLFPTAKYRTQARESAFHEATRFIDELAHHWTTDSSRIHLLYL